MKKNSVQLFRPECFEKSAIDGSSHRLKALDFHLLLKYAESGVLEYWIIDPEKKIILVYRFPQSRFPTCFNFADTVPVGIWNDQMKVDFKEISSELEGLYE